MYHEKLAVAIKHKNRVLREHGDTVYMPFGAEYSVLIKNLNSVKAKVNVFIDETDVTDGSSLVIEPGQSLDLERFIRDGNLETGNRFKFIERTSKIENGPRGIKLEDGLIKINFSFALPQVRPWFTDGVFYATNNERNERRFDSTLGTPYVAPVGPTWVSGSVSGIQCSASASASPAFNNVAVNSVGGMTKGFASSTVHPQNDVGITVPGSASEQAFTHVADFATVGNHVIVLKLLGETGKGKIQEPVTVKSRQKCTTCGHMNKSSAKFCSECGTALELL